MQEDYAGSVARVLVYEGGEVDNPRDPGGRTNRGITQTTFNAYARSIGQPARDVYAITDAEVDAIYKTHFWNVVSGDKLPAGLDFVVFDGAVNSGPGQSGKWLQAALGDHYEGARDGMVASKTLQAVEDCVASSTSSLETLIYSYCERRLATLHQLRTWTEFGHGWSARISNGLKIADAMAAGDEPEHPVDVTSVGGHRKAPISDVKPSRVSAAAAHATVIASSASTVATQATTGLAPVRDAFPDAHFLSYIVGGFTAIAAVAALIITLINNAKTAAAAGTATAAVNLDADSGLPQVGVSVATVTPAKGA